MIRKSKMMSALLLILAFSVAEMSAYVYQQSQLTMTQTVKEIATITLENSVLGSINEGETKSYTKIDVSTLGDAIDITTTTTNVYLHLNSDLDSQSGSYSVYNIDIKFATVPSGSSKTVGNVACTLSIGVPDPAPVILDVAGSWTFDFEIVTTAKSVSSDQLSTVTIVVSTEST